MVRNLFKFFVVTLFLVLSAGGGEGDILHAEDDLSFKSFDIRLGLSSNTIRDIAQDKYGCIWIATDEGLNRLCGNRVHKFYKQADGKGLSGNEINCLLNDDRTSTMWIGTQRAGLIAFNYDTGEFRFFRHDNNNPESLVTDAVTDLIKDDNGDIWISTYWEGVDRLDVKTGKFIHYNMTNVEGLKCHLVWSIAFDDTGKYLYLGHEEGGFSIIDIKARKAKTFTSADGLLGNTVRSIHVDGDNVWLGTDKGLCLYKSKSGEFLNFNNDGYNHVCMDIRHVGSELWIAMERRGVLAFDKEAHRFRPILPRYTTNPSDAPEHLYKSEPTKLFLDSYGNILVGTARDGLAGFSTNTSYFFIDNHNMKRPDTDLASADIQAIAVLGNRPLYATNGSGILSDDGFIRKNRDEIPAHILDIITDSKGNIWFCDPNGGLGEYDPAERKLRKFTLDLPEGGHTRNLYDDGKTLLIGSYKGITFFDKKSGKVSGQLKVGNNFIRPVTKDEEGNLYVGTFGDGLFVFDKNLKQRAHHNLKTGLPSNSINDIYITGPDIWLATSEGLVRTKKGELGNFEVVAKPYQSVSSLIEDNEGNIWYAGGSDIGVIKKDGSQISFDRELPVIGFNNTSVAKDSTGRLYFGSNRGVLTFLPESVLESHRSLSPVISDFIVHGRSKDSDIPLNPFSGKDIELSHNQNSFSIYINSLDFFFQENTFEYRLSGMDDNWYQLKDGNEVTYRGLPYGKYEFQIRNAYPGEDNAEIVSMKIHILPPLWLRWWAKAIYVLIVCVAIYLLIRKYNSHVKRKSINAFEKDKEAHIQELHEERLKFFTNITHELRTPLTLIMGPLDDINKSSSLNEKDRWKIQVIRKNAQRLLNLVNQILDFRKTETQNNRLCVSRGNIVAAVREVAMKYIELNRNQKINITVNSSSEDIEMYFDNEVLTIILDNLISNALKYTESGMVSISVITTQESDKRLVRINVKDTGYGISRDALPHIFDRYYQEKSSHQASGTGIGLALVKALVDLHQGSISVESAKDLGTSFTITLDRDNNYPEALHSEPEENMAKPDRETAAEAESAGAEMSRDDNRPDSIVVLVVEDNPDILEYVEQSFADIFDVRTASNGNEGLEIARKVIPDVIVTDIMMPGMDGMEMSRLLKNDVATSHIPIIMLTAKDSTSDREAGYKIGVDSYLTKPFNSSLLLTRINNIVSRRHLMSEYYKSLTQDMARDTGHPDNNAEEKQRLQESMSRIDREFMEKLEKAVADNLASGTVNVDYLTDRMYMSRATLYRKVKALTGMSTNEYIRHVRMQKARDMMLDGAYTISEISDKVGCSSPTYFRESFKAHFGISPSEYLRSLKK